MSTTTNDIKLDGGTRRPQPKAPGPARRVRLPWIAAAGGVALFTAVLMLWGFGQVGDRREVIMMTAPVAEGESITAADLGSTLIAVESSATQLFSVEQTDGIIGRVAAGDLAVGDLIGPSSIQTATAVPDGWVEVGSFIRSSRFPSSMAAGDQMRAIALTPEVADPSGADGQAPLDDGVIVQVVSIERGTDGAILAVLAVPDASSAQVARWSSSDNLVLVKVDQ